jgi:hypothetical protein
VDEFEPHLNSEIYRLMDREGGATGKMVKLGRKLDGKRVEQLTTMLEYTLVTNIFRSEIYSGYAYEVQVV